jgi:long-chain acyl-CoA synthetase
MCMNALFKTMHAHRHQPAIRFQHKTYDYAWLLQRIKKNTEAYQTQGIQAGSVVALLAGYSPESLATFFALLKINAIVMLLPPSPNHKEHTQTVDPEFFLSIDAKQSIALRKTALKPASPLIHALRKKKHPGIIIMSSGSTGKSKAILHDCLLLMAGTKPSPNPMNVLSFLHFDHIGGINTVIHAVFSGHCLVIPKDRTPDAVASCIEHNQVDALITSPSFLNLMLLRSVLTTYDLSSLKHINYGSEVMPQTRLKCLTDCLPKAKFHQAYGLSELGIIKTRSPHQHSPFMQFEDKNIKFRVKKGILEIQSTLSMLGYLNAPNPFSEDGWFITGDAVEVSGNALRIVGRDSDMINVGGEKVFPAEVENTLLHLNEIEDATVFGEKNAILGHQVVAHIKLKAGICEKQFFKKARLFCLDRLPSFKVPQKIIFTDAPLHNARFKKKRKMTEP